QGLHVVKLLDANDVPGASGRRIHRLKYLTQAYRYDDALALSEELADHEWGAVYRINALMALDRVEEARALAQAHLMPSLSECQAVLRRNTITLFDVDTALRHLDEAYGYFEREQSDFRLATVDANRSVVYLHARRSGDALRSLEAALARMRFVGSREVFQTQVNLAIRSALLTDFEAALVTLEEAALHVPRALLFDQVKIAMNQAVIGCVGGTLSFAEGERMLDECVRRIRGVQMPYLHRALISNIATARGEPNTGSGRASDRVSLGVRLPADTPGAAGGPWTVMSSVHWRY
ncbi:MAG: hypothetical protein QOJ29_1272, partial [Thermoleophilaceae bacterium]|nr:hypothetical protein [Thermoleophilaceae bacterium]